MAAPQELAIIPVESEVNKADSSFIRNHIEKQANEQKSCSFTDNVVNVRLTGKPIIKYHT